MAAERDTPVPDGAQATPELDGEAEGPSEEELAAAREKGAKAERARMKALREAFPNRLTFAMDAFAKGSTVEEARVAFGQVIIDELKEENARLKREKAAPEGTDPVGFAGEPGDKPHLERAKEYQAEHGGPEKCSITKALRATAPRRE